MKRSFPSVDIKCKERIVSEEMRTLNMGKAVVRPAPSYVLVGMNVNAASVEESAAYTESVLKIFTLLKPILLLDVNLKEII